MEQVKIYDYNCYEYVIQDKGTNCSDVVTKMVHLAGRICEKYASDIVYDANEFMEAVKGNMDFQRYLFFREMGVTAFKPEDIESIKGTEYIQVWHLSYNAATQEQVFKRVNVYFERRYI